MSSHSDQQAPVRRTGIPLSVRLILTTSIVVAGAVFVSALFSQRALEDLARADADSRRKDGNAAIQRESDLLSRNVATAVSIPLGAGLLGDVPPLLLGADNDYERIQWLRVVDQTGQTVAATEGAPPATPDDPLTAKLETAPAGTVERTGAGTDWVYGTVIRLGSSVLGQLRMGVSTADLEAELARSIDAAAARAAASRRQVTLVSLILLAAGMIVAALQGLRMAAPLRQLAHQAERIARGDLDQRVPDKRGDEIGQLARNFNFMAARIGDLLVEKVRAASLEREMSLARQVQQSMLPPPDLVVHGPIRVVGHCVPASSCGGDWWTYRKMASGQLLLVIGDATGHGLHSALIASTARGAVEALADADERLLTPEQVLKGIHAAISGIGDNMLLMTCFAAVIEPQTATLHYANAGQNFPYVMRRSTAGPLDTAQIIAASGNPLGDPNVPQSLRRGTVPIHQGDVLVAFTDGVVERSNGAGKLFGDRRLRTVFHGQLVDTPDQLLDLRQRVVQAIDVFAEGTDAEDDVTFVLVQVEPANRGRMRTAS